MVQGGGFSADKPSASGYGAITSFPQIPLEGTLSTGLANQRGTIAMARTNDPNSASSQFFVNVVDNAFLNETAATGAADANPGYAVFGAVASGLEVFDAIAKAPLRNAASGGNDTSWGTQNSGALFEDITEPVVVIEQAGLRAAPAQLHYTLLSQPAFGTVSWMHPQALSPISPAFPTPVPIPLRSGSAAQPCPACRSAVWCSGWRCRGPRVGSATACSHGQGATGCRSRIPMPR